MARRVYRIGLPAVLLLVTVILLRRTLKLRHELGDVAPSPDPWLPITEQAPAPAWVEAVEGACPSTHPIKAKATSHIYHLPGMANYARTNPDRCYADESAAMIDGFIKAKR